MSYGLAEAKDEIERLKAELQVERAEHQETRNALDIARADLSRLTPSGQVVEDEALLARFIDEEKGVTWVVAERLEEALSRLAAKAQGYEAMKAERDAASAESVTHLEWMREERARAEQAETERDAAVADNAAKGAAMVTAAAELWHTYGNHAKGYRLDPQIVARAIRILEEGAAQPHPGAALLKQLQEQKETSKALTEALVFAESYLEIGTMAARENVCEKIARLRLAGRLP